MFQLQKLFNKFSLNKFITKCSADSNVKSVLNNRFLLYALSLIVFLDLIYLANLRSFNTIIIFILVGFLTSFFCKNMIVIMIVALFIAHILKNPSSFEGAANMDEEDEEEEEDTDENYENKEKEQEKEDPDDADDKKVREELKEFATVQKEIIDSMTKLEPLMAKAEGFIQKFEKYSKSE
jgi:hypothetical protein